MRLLWLAASCTTAATAALVWALLTGDHRLTYVADTTSRSATWPVRLAGLWGGMAGSLLLWCCLLLVVAVVGDRAVRRSRPDLAPVARSAMAAVAAGFLAVGASSADPFTTLAIPAIDGGGLAPILQRPAMLYHPPLLYAGLVAMVVPFGLAVAALVRGGADVRWLALVRKAAGVAWVLLTLGVLAGAHWAYGELGWGGFWAWDPIENAALLPWLAATALLHAVLVDEHRAPAPPRRSTVALATLPLVLVVLGALLTRSGAVSSVHAFAEARAVGRGLLVLLVVVAAATAGAVVRAWRRDPAPPTWRWSGRRAALAACTAVLLLAALVVATGTLYPLVVELGDGRVAVAGTFFARFTAPLALVAAVLLGVGPRLRWSRGRRPVAVRSGGDAPAAVAAAAVAGAAALVTGAREPFALAVLVLAAASGVLLAADAIRHLRSGAPAAARRRAGGAAVAHLGAVLLLAGIGGATLDAGTTALLAVDERTTVAGTTVTHRGVVVEDVAGGRRVGVDVGIARGGREVGALRPAQTVFEALGEVRSDPALRSTPVEDVQVVLRRLDAEGTALLDIAVRPLVQWVWWGGLVLAAGGALALTAGPPARTAPRQPGAGATAPAQRGAAGAARPPAAAVLAVAAAVPAPTRGHGLRPSRLRSSSRPSVGGGGAPAGGAAGGAGLGGAGLGGR